MKLYDPLKPPIPSKPGQVMHWGNLIGSGLTYCLKQLVENQTQLILMITPNSQSAMKLKRELRVFLDNPSQVLHFPDWETLAYDHFSPHYDIISERLATLAKLPSMSQGILVVPITTLLQRIVPASFIQAFSLDLKVDNEIDLNKFKHQLVEAGYRKVSEVGTHGEFAQRGSIIDLFPMGLDYPIRIDLFDNKIETLRTFDPDTQRSLEKINHVNLLPAHEFPLDEEAVTRFRTQWRLQFEGNPTESPIYRAISEGISPPGIEYYLPLFFKELGTLFSHLPQNVLVFRHPELESSINRYWHDISERYEQRRHNIARPLIPPYQLILRENEFFTLLKSYPQIKYSSELLSDKASHYSFNFKSLPNLAIESQKKHPLENLTQFIKEFNGHILFCAESKGRKETLLELLERIDIHPSSCSDISEFLLSSQPFQITIAPIDEGMIFPLKNYCVIAEAQLYGNRIMQRRRRQRHEVNIDTIIKDLTELKIGSAVVHLDYGVGKYIGLKVIDIGNNKSEYLTLEYANQDKLYVPVSSLNLITQYSGTHAETTPLNKLGSDHFEKAKERAKHKAFDVAAELLEIYAEREAKIGYAFPKPDENYSKFVDSFPYEETPDQTEKDDKIEND